MSGRAVAKASIAIMFAAVTLTSLLLFVVGLGILAWQLLPAGWQSYLEAGDSSLALLGLFLGVPVSLGLLALLGLIVSFRIMSHFATREEAQSFLLSGWLGGHIGPLEHWMLSWYPSSRRTDI